MFKVFQTKKHLIAMIKANLYNHAFPPIALNVDFLYTKKNKHIVLNYKQISK